MRFILSLCFIVSVFSSNANDTTFVTKEKYCKLVVPRKEISRNATIYQSPFSQDRLTQIQIGYWTDPDSVDHYFVYIIIGSCPDKYTGKGAEIVLSNGYKITIPNAEYEPSGVVDFTGHRISTKECEITAADFLQICQNEIAEYSLKDLRIVEPEKKIRVKINEIAKCLWNQSHQ